MSAPVPRRLLGRTGLEVSVIGFGCGPTAGLMVDGSPQQRLEVVARALDAGINYFDTAPGYGHSRSERHLGDTLRALGRAGQDAIVATKVALSADDLSDIGAAVRRSVAASLAHLGLTRLPVVQLHNRVGPTRTSAGNLGSAALLSVEDVLGPGGVVEALRSLQAQGRIGALGASAYGGDMAAVRRLVDSGEFDLITVNHSLLNETAWRDASERAAPGLRDYAGIGRHAADAGLGVVSLRVLEGGLLAGPQVEVPGGERRQPPGQAVLAERAAVLYRQPQAPQGAGDAIRGVLAVSQVSTALIGLSDVHQVDAAVAAAREGPLATARLVQWRQALAAPIPSDPSSISRTSP